MIIFMDTRIGAIQTPSAPLSLGVLLILVALVGVNYVHTRAALSFPETGAPACAAQHCYLPCLGFLWLAGLNV